MAVIIYLQKRGRGREGREGEREGGGRKGGEERGRGERETWNLERTRGGQGRMETRRGSAPLHSGQVRRSQQRRPGAQVLGAGLRPRAYARGRGGRGAGRAAPGAAAGSGNSWCPSPRAPLPPESGEDSEDPLATTSARAGVKEHPSPLVTETKTRGPSRQVKVQDAASPRLLPEGGGDPPRAPRTRRGPASAGFFPLHPLLIKVGSLHDNHGERG